MSRLSRLFLKATAWVTGAVLALGGLIFLTNLLLTAREVSAQEAKEIGLIGRVVPDGTALDAALEIAEVVGANGPLAVEAIKASVKATEGIPEEEALKMELEFGWPIFATEDAAEGQKAFAEKRVPEYKRR